MPRIVRALDSQCIFRRGENIGSIQPTLVCQSVAVVAGSAENEFGVFTGRDVGHRRFAGVQWP